MCVCRLVCVSACMCLCVHASTFMHVHACVYELMCVHDHSENLLAPKWKRKKLVSLDLCVYLSTGLTAFQSPKQFLLNDSHKKLVVCYVHHVFWLCNLTLSLWLHCVRHCLQSWDERLLEFLFLYVVILIITYGCFIMFTESRTAWGKAALNMSRARPLWNMSGAVDGFRVVLSTLFTVCPLALCYGAWLQALLVT